MKKIYSQNLLRNYECLIIELVIAIRLGGQFFVQLMNLLLTGDRDGNTVFATYYKYILILGSVYSLFLIFKKKIYKYLNRGFGYYVIFVLLYVGILYYYLKIDPESTYRGAEANAKFNTVLNNVLLFGVVAIIYATHQLNQIHICKFFIFINLITSILYMNNIGVDYGDAYDGFLLQSTGFSSLAVGYLTGANFIVTIFLANSWCKNRVSNYIITGFILSVFGYMLLMCGKTGPILFTLFTSLFALKYSLLPNLPFKLSLFFIVISTIFFLIFYRQFADIVSIMNPRLAEKIIATINKGDTSNRDFLFKEAFWQIINHPLFGSYFELKKYNFYPHNFFLENLITWGITGTVLMLRILYIAFRSIYYHLKTNSQYIWIGLVFIFSFLGAQTTGSLYGNYRFWFCLTIIMVLKYTKNRMNKITEV